MARYRRPAGLPDFDDPPLTEVALSIQFEALSAIEFVDLGPLWQQLRRRHPKVEEHPPLSPSFEIFGVPSTPSGSVQIQLSAMPTMPRFWFVNDVGSEILQFQLDRFVHNWRKVGEGAEYPRYEHIRRIFLGEFTKLSRFIEKHLDRVPAPNQCEITYVNQIPLPNGETDIEETLAILRIPDDFPGGGLDDVGMQIRFVLPGTDKHPVGRLTVQAGPAVTPIGVQVFQLMLTVRGRPATPDVEGAREFMDMGREVIVNSFAALTTDRMHNLWGRRK
jgi:uncharacterized protein (TIGR04255 family)